MRSKTPHRNGNLRRDARSALLSQITAICGITVQGRRQPLVQANTRGRAPRTAATTLKTMHISERDRRTLDRAAHLLGSPLTFTAQLTGGEHARTLLAESPTGRRVVVRYFPPGDPAGCREVGLAPSLEPLGSLVPRLLAAETHDDEGSVLVTEYVEGTACPRVDDEVVAKELGAALATIHSVSGVGLRRVPQGPPDGAGPMAAIARDSFPYLTHGDLVLTHYDFWIGNTLWREGHVTAVVDWSGARQGPRAVDLAWLRLDLILQGRKAAADLVVSQYERHSRQHIHDLAAWDLQAVAQAEPDVESWAPNYQGIGLAHLTAECLRARLTQWCETLVTAAKTPR